MGIATSTVKFFRNLGGAFGTALFSAILNTRLGTHVADTLGPAAAGSGKIDTRDVFLTALPVVALALIVSFFIKEIPLRTRADAEVPVTVSE